MPNPTPLTPELVSAHERLHPRLAALMKQVERVAARRPRDPVPDESARLARELVREAAKLLGREGRRLAVPASGKSAPLDHAGLAVALGQALAALEAFEAGHTGPDKRGTLVWQVVGGVQPPVARHQRAMLAKKPGAALPPPHQPDYGWMGKNASEARRRVLLRIVERENEAYMAGYRDAVAGKQPRAPKTGW